MTRIGFITTRQTNVGDDLIRCGIEHLLTACIGQPLEFVVINKHTPLEVFRNPILGKLVDALPRGKITATRALARASRPFGLRHHFEDVDFVVQCGTPMMWPDCHRAEWLPALWENVLARPGSPRVISLAAGSAYPWLSPRPPHISRADAVALRRVLGRSELTTFRDGLAAEVAERLGTTGPVLPCTAMHWAHGTAADPNAEAVILNVMPRGGHFLWGQNLPEHVWHREIDVVIRTLARDHPLILLCHDTTEYELAARWPDHERVLASTPADYLEVARRGRVGLVNRMHAAVALAGIGVPAVAVGTDTRLLMVDEVGQKTEYLGNASADRLLDAISNLLVYHAHRRSVLLDTEAAGFRAHLDLLTGFIGSAAVRLGG